MGDGGVGGGEKVAGGVFVCARVERERDTRVTMSSLTD